MYKLFVFISVSVFSQNLVCTISGSTLLKNQSKKAYLFKVNYETKIDELVDSITLKNDGRFTKIIPLKEPSMYNLVLPDKTTLPLAIDKSESLIINFTISPVTVFGSQGTQLLIDYEQFRKKSFEKRMKPVYDSISMFENAGNQSQKRIWMKNQPNAYNQHRIDLTGFVRKNLMNSTASYASCLRWNPNTDLSFIDSLVTNIQLLFPNSQVADHLKSRFERIKATAIGSQAPEIALADSSGKIVFLSSKRGKYILLDFWASWCGPCRQMSELLVDFNQKFKDKKVEIFSVSLDDKAKNWKKAIVKDKYTWTNVSDLLGWKSKTAFQYNVNAIPTNFLIDDKGKIIAKNFNFEEAIDLINKELSK